MIKNDYYRNLVAGQWQIGSVVMGHGTNIKVEAVDVKPYDVDDQDYQVSRTNEKRFGFDYLKPTTIELTMQVLNNRMLPGYESKFTNFWHNMPTVSDLAREWRADDVRTAWGQMKALYVCSKLDQVPKIIFGRTGQFGYTFDDGYNKGEVVKAIGEFRRADTLAYSVTENSVDIALGQTPTWVTRTNGDGPDSWYRLLLTGPITNPVITVGEQQIELNVDIASGSMVEISSYPWQRRAVASNRTNLAANLIGQTKYLDQLVLPYKVPVPVKWTSQQYNTWVPALGNQSWEEDIDDHKLFKIPTTFTTLSGTASVRYDLFNFGSTVFPWMTPRTYLASAILSNKTAVLYNAKKYNTADQCAQARIVNPQAGKSAIVIMSTTTMSNYACLIVESSISGRFLRIATGSSPTATLVRSSWQNPSAWLETDDITFDFNSATKTYTGYLNGVAKVTWTDSGVIVGTGTANRSQGFLFDVDGNLATAGVGFTSIIAYDKTTVPAPTGKVSLLWRDSYSVI